MRSAEKRPWASYQSWNSLSPGFESQVGRIGIGYAIAGTRGIHAISTNVFNFEGSTTLECFTLEVNFQHVSSPLMVSS